MRSCEDKLRTAQINLKGGSEKRRNALDRLREICEEHSDTPCAQKAHELLRKHAPAQEEGEREELPSLSALREKWASLNGLRDGRFYKYFQAIQEHDLVLRMKETVVRSLRNWLEDECTRLNNEKRLEDAEKITEILQEIESVEAYADELGDVRKRVREAVFEIRFEDLRGKVERSLKQWKMQEAWEHWRVIQKQEPIPDDLQDEVAGLRRQIEETHDVQEAVEDRLDELSETRAESWGDVNRAVQLIQELGEYMEGALPESVEREIKSTTDAQRASLIEFVVERVERVERLSGLSELWRRYWKTELSSVHDERKKVITKSRTEMKDIVRRRLEHAEKPTEVEALKEDLDICCSGASLPRDLDNSAEALRRKVQKIGRQWRSMRAGERFDVPDNSLPIPSAFEEETGKYKEYLSDIDEYDFRDEKGLVLEDTLDDAIEVAREILKEVDGHHEARALKQDAEERLLRLELDRSLAHWELEDFQEYAGRQNAPERYRRVLQDHFETLQEMNRLQMEEKHTEWEELMRWSEDWETALEDVKEGSSIPVSLEEAISHETEKRKKQWKHVLKKLREQTAKSADELEEVHEDLADILGVFDGLNSHRKELKQEILKRRMRGALDDGEIGDAQRYAEEWQEKIDDDLPRDLSVRLDVERAREEGPEAVAECLHHRWVPIRDAYEREAFALLVDALEKNWTAKNEETLRNHLRPLTLMVLSVPDAEMPSQLRRWKTWLKLEEDLQKNVSLSKLKDLEDYASSPPNEDVRDRQLKRLVEQWRETENLHALSWMFRAFPEDRALLFPDRRDPMVQFREQSRKKVESIREDLAEEVQSVESSLDGCRRRLEEEKKRWKDCEDFLRRAGFEALECPGELDEADQLLGVVDKVYRAHKSFQRDFIRDRDGNNFHPRSFDKTYDKIQKISATPLRTCLSERHKALKRLILDILPEEQRVKDVAESCGDLEGWTRDGDPDQKYYDGEGYDEEEKPPFWVLARCLENIKERFDNVPSDWREEVLSYQQYWIPDELAHQFETQIRDWAGVREWPEDQAESWDGLIARVEALDQQEQHFRTCVAEMKNHSVFDPTLESFSPNCPQHQEFLGLIPEDTPRSDRVFHFFKLFTRRPPMPKILSECKRADVPDWVYQEGLTDPQRWNR